MSDELDKIFNVIEDFAKEPEKQEKIYTFQGPGYTKEKRKIVDDFTDKLEHIDDDRGGVMSREELDKVKVPSATAGNFRRKRGRPKKLITSEEQEKEKYIVARILKLLCVGISLPDAAKMLGIGEQTAKTLKKQYKMAEFIEMHNLNLELRIDDIVENYLYRTVNKTVVLEVEKKKDLSFDERLELLADIAQNKTLDTIQRIQAIKAIGDLKGDKVKRISEGELITLKLEDMFEPEEEVVEPEPEVPTVDIPKKKEDRGEGAPTDISLEFVFDDSDDNTEDLFKGI